MSGEDLDDVVGSIDVHAAHWSIENRSSELAVVAENTVDGHDFVKIMPGRSVPVPFAASRVLVLTSDGVYGFFVRTDFYDRGVRQMGSPRPSGSPLDEDAKYFRVLVALCEPALRSGSVTVPTSAQIARRLRALPAYRHMATTHVQFHLNYLLTNKLQEHLDAYSSIQGSPIGGTHSRRSALIDLALRFNLVTHRHLALLDPDTGDRLPPTWLMPPAS